MSVAAHVQQRSGDVRDRLGADLALVGAAETQEAIETCKSIPIITGSVLPVPQRVT